MGDLDSSLPVRVQLEHESLAFHQNALITRPWARYCPEHFALEAALLGFQEGKIIGPGEAVQSRK